MASMDETAQSHNGSSYIREFDPEGELKVNKIVVKRGLLPDSEVNESLNTLILPLNSY